MARDKRANGAGTVYVKHGALRSVADCRWRSCEPRVGPVRRPGTSHGLTRSQAEKRLREAMAAFQVTADVERTVAVIGEALLGQLEVKGCAKSYIETVESHLRVHLVPFFGDRPVDRIGEEQVTRLVGLRRSGQAPKTTRNIMSTLHSLFELAVRRRWAGENPCKRIDLPAARPSGDIRFLTQPGLTAVLTRGVPDDDCGRIERPLYLMAAMTGLRLGELIGLRWGDLDLTGTQGARQAGLRPRRVQAAQVGPGHRVCRSRPSSRSRLSRSAETRTSQATRTWCSPTPLRASRWIALRCASGSSVRAGAQTFASCGFTTCVTLRDPDRRVGGSIAANPAGVDGPPRSQDHDDLRGLPARRARGRDRDSCLRDFPVRGRAFRSVAGRSSAGMPSAARTRPIRRPPWSTDQ